MNKTVFLLVLAILTLALALPGLAAIQSINYPAANEVITETARIRLNVSSAASQSCYFNYNNVRNQTIGCNGVSLVDLPAASGVYNITVGDNASSSITHQITVIQNDSNLALFIYILSCLSILAIIFLTIHLIAKLALFETSVYDVALSYLAYFGLMISYQLSLEYARVGFLLSWQELFLSLGGWIMLVFSLTNFTLCSIIRNTQKKSVKDERTRL